VDPEEGRPSIDFQRSFDPNAPLQGAWDHNHTVGRGGVLGTGGAKWDHRSSVCPGDMTTAVAGVAVSTYDMLAVRNALDVIYSNQYHDDSIPYRCKHGVFNDIYHLHTLIGSYEYVLYSGDLDWLGAKWGAYKRALEVSIRKVDETGLFHVSSVFDWIRPRQMGHNVGASAILHNILENSVRLASWIGDRQPIERWLHVQKRFREGLSSLYCEQDGLFSDDTGKRGCSGPEKVLPQDGNSWVLLSNVVESQSIRYNISHNLRARWTKYGAPDVQFPNAILPISSSYELLAHIAAENHDAAVELIELMWGYMLAGPGVTNSTLIEGYRIDGDILYPAYWSASRVSHAHGWSTGPTTVLMQGILGIRLVSPLGKTWEIEPHLTKWLSYARGGFATNLGKFEVYIALMQSQKSGRKIETLKITVPNGSTGWVRWGGKAVLWSADRAERVAWYRYLEPKNIEEENWQDWNAGAEEEYVRDETWVKPDIEERPVGNVDWEVMRKNTQFARKRYDELKHGLSTRAEEIEPENMGYQELLDFLAEENRAGMSKGTEQQDGSSLDSLLETVDHQVEVIEERLKSWREERAAWAEWYVKEVHDNQVCGICGRDCWHMYRIAMMLNVKDKEEAMMRLDEKKQRQYREVFQLRKASEERGEVESLGSRWKKPEERT
jgi:hypothetical protein